MVPVRKLYRSRTNKMLSGLCGGLSELTNIDATLFRILLVVLTIFSSGALIIVYIIVSMIVPKTPNIYDPYGPRNSNGNPFGGNPFGGNPFGHQDPTQGRSNYHGSTNQRTSFDGNWSNARPSEPTSFSSAPQTGDQMMDDLEKKALRREIDELKAKLSQVEKGE